MESHHKSNTWQGFVSLFGSMILYAFSGIVVVGLSSSFGNIGQVTFRALMALVLIVMWITITGLSFEKGPRLRLSKKYDKKWLTVDIVSRSIFNVSFVYSVLAIGPTSALFYLFAAKVIVGGLIKYFSRKPGDKFFWSDYLTYGVVITGLVIYSFPLATHMSFGILFALISGGFEALKSKAMNELSVTGIDRPVVALYEFSALAIITSVAVIISGQTFVVSAITSGVWLVLGGSALVAVGGLYLELVGFSKYDSDLGNSILASEMGFAGMLNYMFLGTMMSMTQIIGSSLLVFSLFFVAFASYLRNMRKLKSK